MPATDTAATPKKTRTKKGSEAPAEPVDFKTMAAQTRAKMQASHERGKALGGKKAAAAAPVAAEGVPADTDLPFPVSEAQLEAASTEGQPFAAAVVSPTAESFPVGSRVRFEESEGVWLDGILEQHLQGDGMGTCLIAVPVESGPPQHFTGAYGDLQLVALPGTLAAKVLRDLVPGELIGEMPAAAPELPGTPVLISPTDLAPGTLGLHAVPLHQTARSGCNVRHHYDPAAIEELAASLRAEGQIENATGRWNAEGVVEIVAGESRRRAQLLRAEGGEQGLTLLVNIRELTDAEALSISATENMRRRQMTALEECEAMHRLNEAGRSVEEIQAMFGYKSAQPVADRILVAKNLHTTPRELLDRGELSLACAMVIARAPGQDLQLSMTQDATRAWNRATAAELSKRLTQGQFLVTEARFDVDTSGLQVKRDLFDAFEPYFEDKAAALNLQIQWAQARADKLRQKGKQEFVHVVTDGSFDRYGRVYYGHAGAGRGGYVITVSPQTGAVNEHDQVLLRPGKSVTTDETGKSKVESVKPMPDSAYLAAHQMRATAARTTILGNNHLTLAMAVWGLVLGGSDSGVGRVNLTSVNREHAPIPALEERAEALGQLLAPYTSGTSVHIAALSVSGVRPDPARLLERLIAMTDEELLGHLNTLIARSAYDWSQYNNKDAAKPEYALLASLTGAAAHLAQSFKLTDEWLKRYPRQDLVALAEEAGLGRALVEDCGTLKEMRARILEHADQLHAAGFVPRLVQFPAPPTPAAPATAAD
ncbi:ParB/RepB/Spo0J family partition protein [Deinococcus multiflagellatus]|uniref:ParB/RepB/Spo0J family partition protein n=1 Tax=Deinococcus multiflagellatus TaxID=1656887 RepID=A0ABW1ZIF5_9DEIO|nr:ParB N-terminal domain-containing protein [Deinococcus multiflagellatus]MBZ9713784.1 ParB N-terminal domain-containing protein [Deinococcus multiflagellatus]